MIQLPSGATLSGKAGANSAISYHVEPDTIVSGVDDFTPTNNQLTTSTATMFTATGGSTLIKSIQLTNTTASPVTGIVLYRGGTTATNQIVQLSLVANGSATYEDGFGWQTYDSGGNILGGSGIVTSVTAADSSITVAGTSTAPTISRAALTGDVTASGGSNATTIKNDVVLAGNPTTTTQSQGNNSTRIATTAYADTLGATKVPNTRTLTTTAPLTIDATTSADLSANRTLAISAATTTTPGSLSAANYKSINNYFNYTVFLVDDYGVTPGATAAANVTAMNALTASAPDGAKFLFGPYTYQFNAGLTQWTKDFAWEGVYGQTTIAITADMGASTAFIKFNNTGFYSSITNLNFVNFATQTSSNYVIQNNNCAVTQIINCFFTGAAQWAGILDFTGTSAGNGTTIRNMFASQWSGKAINVASPLDTMNIEDLLIIGAGLSGQIGIYCSDGGAMLINDSQIISADVNVKLEPANGKTVSAVFATNCFFDQGKTNCLLITGVGTGTVARCHFVASWFTISGTASVGGAGSNTKCIQITSAGTGIHAGIQFQDCEIMNATTGSTGTLEGINATAIQDMTVMGCQFAAWTNDIQITPASNGTCAPNLVGNTFSTWGLITGSANNVILNAGSFTYGQIGITGNTFNGTTSKLTDNAAVAAGAQKLITGNVGLVQPGLLPALPTTRLAMTASALNLVPGTSLQLPTNGLRIGSQLRFTVALEKTAAGIATWTAKVKYGTANTTADAEIASWTSGTNTALADGGTLVLIVRVTAVGASATVAGAAILGKGPGALATGLGGLGPATTATTAFNSTTANPWVHVDITPGAAAVMTATGTVAVDA